MLTMGKDLTLGERAINWAKAFGLLIGAFATAYGAVSLRGEPQAELAYKTLVKQVNTLTVELGEHKSYIEGFLNGLGEQHALISNKPVVKEILEEEKGEIRPKETRFSKKPEIKLVPEPIMKTVIPNSDDFVHDNSTATVVKKPNSFPKKKISLKRPMMKSASKRPLLPSTIQRVQQRILDKSIAEVE